jgi:hypothetical protein
MAVMVNVWVYKVFLEVLRYVILSGNRPIPYLGNRCTPLAMLFKRMT